MSVKFDQIKRSLRQWFSPGAASRPDLAKLKELACGIVATRPDEIDCGECFERLGRFAEMVAAGRSPSRAMSLVQDHLERCPDCRQEYLALMEALQADTSLEVLPLSG